MFDDRGSFDFGLDGSRMIDQRACPFKWSLKLKSTSAAELSSLSSSSSSRLLSASIGALNFLRYISPQVSITKTLHRGHSGSSRPASHATCIPLARSWLRQQPASSWRCGSWMASYLLPLLLRDAVIPNPTPMQPPTSHHQYYHLEQTTAAIHHGHGHYRADARRVATPLPAAHPAAAAPSAPSSSSAVVQLRRWQGCHLSSRMGSYSFKVFMLGC